MSVLRPSTIGLAGLLLATSAAAPRAQEAARNQSSYRSGATAILVDVVVRDRQGRPITDLTAADFTLTEDSVPQKVDSFTRITRGGGIGVGVAWKSPATNVSVASAADVAGETESAEPVPQGTTAIVFDHLSADSLRLAQRASLQYIPMSGDSDVRLGVFATESGVRVVQGYTTDRSRVRGAIARLVPSGTSATEMKAERMDTLMERRRELKGETQTAEAGVVAGSGAALAGNASELGRRENELKLVQMELNMIRSFDNLDRDHKGFDTSIALLSVIRSLAEYPGRKTVVFFSEGLPVSPALSAKLDAVIEAANRANVTAYAVDAHGLRAKSSHEALRKEVGAFVEERHSQIATGGDRTESPLTMAFERVEDTLKLDSRTGLARLASDTGGFLVEGSNDLSSAFRRIDEDNRFHYLLTYAPRNAAFDGRFRRIDVKVRRPGAQVFARNGYRAVRAGGSVPGASYESEALALLDRPRLPNAFPVNAVAYSFPEPDRPGLAPVLARVSTSVLRYDTDAARSTYSAQAMVAVRILDGSRRLIEKLTQEYVISGDVKDLAAAKNGEILFYREPQLDPGVYTFEVMVYDAIAGHGSARLTTVTVPPRDRSTLGMSNLVLVSRAENVGAPAAGTQGAPLIVGDTLLYPNMGEPVSRGGNGDLPFYFALYGNAAASTATAQLLRSGTVVAEAPLELPAGTGSRVQHVGRLPVGSLPPGTYELRIAVRAGGEELSRAAFFTLVD